MNVFAKSIIGAAMLAGASVAMTSPASAYVGIEFGFGGPDYAFGDPCDYYDYYDEPPPWGLPPDYCDYPVYFEPVYFEGTWYRGPIYYRWTHGRRLFWLHGGWREDSWRGPRPPRIDWQSRGGTNRGFRPGMNLRGAYRGGGGPRPNDPDGGIRREYRGGGDHSPWAGGDRGVVRPGIGSNPWQGRHDNGGGSHFGGGNPWGGGNRGDGGSRIGGGSHGGFGGHGPH
jgi:hypothetical protein